MQKNVRTLPLRIEPGTVVTSETDHELIGQAHKDTIKTGGKFVVPPGLKKVTSTENLGPVLLDRFYICTEGDDLWPIYMRIHSPTNTKTLLLRDPVINVLKKDNADTTFLPDALIQFVADDAVCSNPEMNFILEDMKDSGKLEPEETCNVSTLEPANFKHLVRGWKCDAVDIPLFMFNSSHPVEDQILQFKSPHFGGVYDSVAYDGFTRLCLDEVLITPSCMRNFGRYGIPKEVHLPPIPFNIDPRKITAKIDLDEVLQKLVVWVNNLQYYEVIFKYTLPIGEEDGRLEICWASKRFSDQVILGDLDVALEDILTPWIGKVKTLWIAKTRNEELYLLLEKDNGEQAVWYIDLVLATLLSQSVARY